MLQMKTKTPRKDHDQYPDWIFYDKKGKAPFTKGTIRMEKADIEKSFELFYELMEFNVETGAPTEKCLKDYQLDYVVPVLRQAGLI